MPIPQANTTPFTEKHPVTGQQHVSFPWLMYLNQVLEWVPAPASATAKGIQGQVAYDATHFYICISKNTWIRVALATF